MKMHKLLYASLITVFMAFPQWVQADPHAEEDKAARESREEVRESLKEAQKHFLEALKILGDTGVKYYERHMPELKERSAEMLEKSQELLETWREKIEKELEEHEKRRKVPKKSEDDDNLPMI